MMRIVSVVGARPQFIKVAPVAHAIPEGVDHLILHTGQHYDEEMSQSLFDELNIPRPVTNLQIGSGTHAAQTGILLPALERVFIELDPDWILVYGDTNTTIAGALTAAKLRIRIAHLEAGLRSYNRNMPEEINRIVTDHVSDLLLAPSGTAMAHLASEGLGSRAVLVGDVMVDSIRIAEAMIEREPRRDSGFPYVAATLHRAGNTDDSERLARLVRALADSPVTVRLAAHPRLIAKAKEFNIPLSQGSIVVEKPQSYLSMVRLMIGSAGVITDSGGLQKEAFLLKIPCLTLRAETEWVETLEQGWNTLDPEGKSVSSQWWRGEREAADLTIYGDGFAAKRVIQSILDA